MPISVTTSSGVVQLTDAQYSRMVALGLQPTTYTVTSLLDRIRQPVSGGTTGKPVPISGGAMTVALTSILRLLPSAAIAAIRAARGQWTRLPGWVRTVLLAIGVSEGTDIMIDDEGSNQPAGGRQPGLPAPSQPGGTITRPDDVPGLDAFPTDGSGRRWDPMHGLIVGGWMANGIPFVRFADGYQAAWKPSSNRWTYWKPAKPIVIMPSGATSPQAAARAHRALKRQAKRLKPLVEQYYPRRRRSTRRETRTQQPDGTTIIQASND